MPNVETRCTQCGNDNTNSVSNKQLKHGTTGHGTEVLFCEDCSGTCHLDECVDGDPCERCYTETVQNRRGSSVPSNAGR